MMWVFSLSVSGSEEEDFLERIWWTHRFLQHGGSQRSGRREPETKTSSESEDIKNQVLKLFVVFLFVINEIINRLIDKILVRLMNLP